MLIVLSFFHHHYQLLLDCLFIPHAVPRITHISNYSRCISKREWLIVYAMFSCKANPLTPKPGISNPPSTKPFWDTHHGGPLCQTLHQWAMDPNRMQLNAIYHGPWLQLSPIALAWQAPFFSNPLTCNRTPKARGSLPWIALYGSIWLPSP